jgi:hypothetical protein
MFVNWKTTLLGFVAAILNILANGATPKQVGLSLALGAFGALAKDHNQ